MPVDPKPMYRSDAIRPIEQVSAMNLLEEYLREMHDIRASGKRGRKRRITALEPAQRHRQDLKPRVRCIINLKNRGAGIPVAACSLPTRSNDAPPKKSRRHDPITASSK